MVSSTSSIVTGTLHLNWSVNACLFLPCVVAAEACTSVSPCCTTMLYCYSSRPLKLAPRAFLF